MAQTESLAQELPHAVAEAIKKKKKSVKSVGVPQWFSELRIWCCHCCGVALILCVIVARKKKKSYAFFQSFHFLWPCPAACIGPRARDQTSATAATGTTAMTTPSP